VAIRPSHINNRKTETKQSHQIKAPECTVNDSRQEQNASDA